VGAEEKGRWCWARARGSCDGGMSGEHLISECVLPEKVTFSGLWSESPIELPRERLVANILCRDHNTALSPVDAAGGRFIEVLEECQQLFDSRRAAPAAPWDEKTFTVDRLLLERWLVKTALNIGVAGKRTIGPDATIEPRRDLVDFVFDGGDLPEGIIIGWVANVGDNVEIRRNYAVTFIDCWRDSKPDDVYTAAVIFRLADFHLVLSFAGTIIPTRILASLIGATSVTIMRLGGINFTVNERMSHSLVFDPQSEIIPQFPAGEVQPKH
jgi:hypothetical protein